MPLSHEDKACIREVAREVAAELNDKLGELVELQIRLHAAECPGRGLGLSNRKLAVWLGGAATGGAGVFAGLVEIIKALK